MKLSSKVIFLLSWVLLSSGVAFAGPASGTVAQLQIGELLSPVGYNEFILAVAINDPDTAGQYATECGSGSLVFEMNAEGQAYYSYLQTAKTTGASVNVDFVLVNDFLGHTDVDNICVIKSIY